LAVGDHVREVAIGRCHQTHIHADCPRAPEALEFLLLQSAEQLRLEFERDVADFVEKQGPAIREFETANPLRNRAGESALLVTKQFALKKPRRNG
jgi:hypothetical protein